MATMQDVARTAGVSTATVSRVLRSPASVTEATRKRVQQVMSALDYSPNLAGKSLRTSRTDRILVLIPDISNPFFSAVLRGIEEEAQRAGYAVLLGDTRSDPERENEYASMFRQREADGLVLLGHRIPTSLIEPIKGAAHQLPIVFGCDGGYDRHTKISSVRIDNVAAASAAVAHLVDLGHRRIGIITGPLDAPLNTDRLKGARAAARECELIVAVGDYSVSSGEAQAEGLLSASPRPTAIFAFSDEMAIGAIAAARRLGLVCPVDVSIVGFDDIRVAESITPPLTTIRQPMQAMGREIILSLLKSLEGELAKPILSILPYQLVIRESTTAPNMP